MHKRIILLLALVAFVGLFTRAFAADARLPMHAAAGISGSISRAGAVALIVESQPEWKSRVEWYAGHMPPLPLFDDIDQHAWYAPYIEVAFEKGIINGNDDRTFRPDHLLAQEEATVMAMRMFEETQDIVYLTVPTSPKSTWYAGPVTTALSYQLDLPFPLRAGKPITRKDFYALLQSAHVENPAQIAAAFVPVKQTHKVLVPVKNTIVASTGIVPAARPRATVATIPLAATVTPPLVGEPIPTKAFSISMPTLGIKDLTITHPSDPFTSQGLLAPLKYGVGHLFGYPGKGGTILVYGHSSSYPWDVSQYTKVFRGINKLSVGDTISVNYGGNVYHYRITLKQTVPASDMSAYQGGNGEELILYTCWPPDSVSQRYLVHATPVEAVAMR